MARIIPTATLPRKPALSRFLNAASMVLNPASVLSRRVASMTKALGCRRANALTACACALM
jgi:hypothetical protein